MFIFYSADVLSQGDSFLIFNKLESKLPLLSKDTVAVDDDHELWPFQQESKIILLVVESLHTSEALASK